MSPNKSFNDLDINELLQAAKNTQSKIKIAQNKLDNTSVVGIAGNQNVKITITGKGHVINTFISDSVFTSKHNLEKLITAAINDAFHKLELVIKDI